MHCTLQVGLGILRSPLAHSRVPQHLPCRQAHAPGGLPLAGQAVAGQHVLHELVGSVPLAVGVEGKGPAVGSHDRAGGHAVAPRSMHIGAGGALRARADRMHGGLLGQQLPGICGRLRALAPRRWHLGHLLHDRLPVLLIGLPSMPILGLLLLLLGARAGLLLLQAGQAPGADRDARAWAREGRHLKLRETALHVYQKLRVHPGHARADRSGHMSALAGACAPRLRLA